MGLVARFVVEAPRSLQYRLADTTVGIIFLLVVVALVLAVRCETEGPVQNENPF